MTVLRRNNNGQFSRYVSASDRELITPEGLAALIATQVAKQLMPVQKSLLEALRLTAAQMTEAETVASKVIHSVHSAAVEAAWHIEQATACSVDEIRRETAEAAAEIRKVTQEWIENIHSGEVVITAAGQEVSRLAKQLALEQVAEQIVRIHAKSAQQVSVACQRIEQRQNEVIASTKEAGVERLTSIIGAEIQQYELKKTIAIAISTAVRDVLKEMHP